VQQIGQLGSHSVVVVVGEYLQQEVGGCCQEAVAQATPTLSVMGNVAETPRNWKGRVLMRWSSTSASILASSACAPGTRITNSSPPYLMGKWSSLLMSRISDESHSKT
jgi:hypothetical protein